MQNEYYIPPIHWGVFIEVAKEFLLEIDKIENWQEPTINSLIRKWLKSKSYQSIVLHQPLRVFLTSQEKAPPNHSVMWALGKEESVRRINKGIAYLEGLIEEEKRKSDFGDMLEMKLYDSFPPRDIINKAFNEMVQNCLKDNYSNADKK